MSTNEGGPQPDEEEPENYYQNQSVTELDGLLAFPPSPGQISGRTMHIEQDSLPLKTSKSNIIYVFIIGMCAAFLITLGVLDLVDSVNTKPKPLLLLISLDGTRPQYFDLGLTPNMHKLASEGLFAPMSPVFPSITFPNHYSLVTGVYPETHGIVGNSFRDPLYNETFSYHSLDDNVNPKWWNNSEPIWITAEKAGLITANLFWPGASAPHDGILPTHYRNFSSVDVQQHVDWIFEWIDASPSPQKRPDFIAAYFPHIDSAGHTTGPLSGLVNDTVAQVDQGIGSIIKGLKDRGLYDTTNIIIVSDHGMASTNISQVVFIDDYINLDKISYVFNGPLLCIYPNQESDVGLVFKQLSDGAKANGHFNVWLKEEMPLLYHYNSPRVGPIVLLTETHWSFAIRKTFDKENPPFPPGMHGYSIDDPEMKAIFIAHGPYFEQLDSPPRFFSNLEIYPLLGDLLKIDLLPHNGTGLLVDRKH